MRDWRRSSSTSRSSPRARRTSALGVFLVAAMPETGFVRGVARERAAALTSTFRSGTQAIRGNRILLVILATAFLTGMASEGLDRLWEAHLYTDYRLPALGGISQLYWFAIIGGIATALSVGVLSVSRAVTSNARRDRALATPPSCMTVLVAVGCALFGLAPGFAVAVGGVLGRPHRAQRPRPDVHGVDGPALRSGRSSHGDLAWRDRATRSARSCRARSSGSSDASSRSPRRWSRPGIIQALALPVPGPRRGSAHRPSRRASPPSYRLRGRTCARPLGLGPISLVRARRDRASGVVRLCHHSSLTVRLKQSTNRGDCPAGVPSCPAPRRCWTGPPASRSRGMPIAWRRRANRSARTSSTASRPRAGVRRRVGR